MSNLPGDQQRGNGDREPTDRSELKLVRQVSVLPSVDPVCASLLDGIRCMEVPWERKPYPSQARLASWVGLSPRAVRAHLGHLERLGLIGRDPRGGPGGKTRIWTTLDAHAIETRARAALWGPGVATDVAFARAPRRAGTLDRPLPGAVGIRPVSLDGVRSYTTAGRHRVRSHATAPSDGVRSQATDETGDPVTGDPPTADRARARAGDGSDRAGASARNSEAADGPAPEEDAPATDVPVGQWTRYVGPHPDGSGRGLAVGVNGGGDPWVGVMDDGDNELWTVKRLSAAELYALAQDGDVEEALRQHGLASPRKGKYPGDDPGPRGDRGAATGGGDSSGEHEESQYQRYFAEKAAQGGK